MGDNVECRHGPRTIGLVRDGCHLRDDASVVKKTFGDFGGPVADVIADIDEVHKWAFFVTPLRRLGRVRRW